MLLLWLCYFFVAKSYLYLDHYVLVPFCILLAGKPDKMLLIYVYLSVVHTFTSHKYINPHIHHAICTRFDQAWLMRSTAPGVLLESTRLDQVALNLCWLWHHLSFLDLWLGCIELVGHSPCNDQVFWLQGHLRNNIFSFCWNQVWLRLHYWLPEIPIYRVEHGLNLICIIVPECWNNIMMTNVCVLHAVLCKSVWLCICLIECNQSLAEWFWCTQAICTLVTEAHWVLFPCCVLLIRQLCFHSFVHACVFHESLNPHAHYALSTRLDQAWLRRSTALGALLESTRLDQVTFLALLASHSRS